MWADLVVALHAAFVAFVAFGGLGALRFRRTAWAHLPALAWGVWIEVTGGTCPLTPLENRLRAAEGRAPYETSFVEHYVVPVLYPANLTPGRQLALAAALVVFNAAVYAAVLRRARRAA